MGQGKYTMVIGYRQKIIDPCINPSSLCSIIASRAVAVSTGVISFFHMPAGITDLPVGAELAAAAMLNIIHHLMLPGMQPVGFSEPVTIRPENITNGRTGVWFVWKLCMFFKGSFHFKVYHGAENCQVRRPGLM
jgi:hypothetical protein